MRFYLPVLYFLLSGTALREIRVASRTQNGHILNGSLPNEGQRLYDGLDGTAGEFHLFYTFFKQCQQVYVNAPCSSTCPLVASPALAIRYVFFPAMQDLNLGPADSHAGPLAMG